MEDPMCNCGSEPENAAAKKFQKLENTCTVLFTI